MRADNKKRRDIVPPFCFFPRNALYQLPVVEVPVLLEELLELLDEVLVLLDETLVTLDIGIVALPS